MTDDFTIVRIEKSFFTPPLYTGLRSPHILSRALYDNRRRASQNSSADSCETSITPAAFKLKDDCTGFAIRVQGKVIRNFAESCSGYVLIGVAQLSPQHYFCFTSSPFTIDPEHKTFTAKDFRHEKLLKVIPFKVDEIKWKISGVGEPAFTGACNTALELYFFPQSISSGDEDLSWVLAQTPPTKDTASGLLLQLEVLRLSIPSISVIKPNRRSPTNHEAANLAVQHMIKSLWELEDTARYDSVIGLSRHRIHGELNLASILGKTDTRCNGADLCAFLEVLCASFGTIFAFSTQVMRHWGYMKAASLYGHQNTISASCNSPFFETLQHHEPCAYECWDLQSPVRTYFGTKHFAMIELGNADLGQRVWFVDIVQQAPEEAENAARGDAFELLSRHQLTSQYATDRVDKEGHIAGFLSTLSGDFSEPSYSSALMRHANRGVSFRSRASL